MKVLNFGSLNLDYVYTVDHLAVPGETLAAYSLHTFCGGKGLNQSIALAKAGVPVYHAGLVGEEGEALVEALRESGANTEYVKRIQGKSGHTIIQVDRDGQNCILLFGGANRSVTADFIDEVLVHFEQGDILLLQNEINMLSYIINAAYEKGLRIILNPSPFDSALDDCDFHKVSMLLLNEIEGGQITGEKETNEILKKLKELYPEVQIVLTLGVDGSVYQYKDTRCCQGIYPVKAVDTTAAGDTFTGYFISAIIEGLPAAEGLALAARASAIAVSRQGAAASIPGKEEVLQWSPCEML